MGVREEHTYSVHVVVSGGITHDFGPIDALMLPLSPGLCKPNRLP